MYSMLDFTNMSIMEDAKSWQDEVLLYWDTNIKDMVFVHDKKHDYTECKSYSDDKIDDIVSTHFFEQIFTRAVYETGNNPTKIARLLRFKYSAYNKALVKHPLLKEIIGRYKQETVANLKVDLLKMAGDKGNPKVFEILLSFEGQSNGGVDNTELLNRSKKILDKLSKKKLKVKWTPEPANSKKILSPEDNGR